MKPDDRIRVLAPVSGQVAAFAAVLILGLVFANRSSSHQTPKTPGQTTTLSVAAFEFDEAVPGDQVKLFQAGSLHRIGHGQTDGFGYFSLAVRPGAYQVCLKIPAGYTIGSSNATGQSSRPLILHQPPTGTGLPARSWECAVVSAGAGLMGTSWEFTKPAPPGQIGSPNSSSAYLRPLSSRRALEQAL